jgi:hypothetical protein
MQSTSDGKKIWKIKLKIGKRITKHMRVCWKHFVDEDFVPLVCWFGRTVHLFDSFEVRYAAQPWREKRLEMAFPMLPMLKIRTL